MLEFILSCIALFPKACFGFALWVIVVFVIIFCLSFISKYYRYCKEIRGGD